PIYQTTSFVFDDTDHAANLFALAEPGNIYTRIMNPTQDTVEQRLAALGGGVAALLVASGMAATTYAIQNIVENGGHVVSSPRVYGGTFNLFHYTLPKFGIDVTFVDDPDDLESWRAAIQPNTRAVFAETISNPHNQILDIAGLAKVAHDASLPLIVDNTVATPYLLNPIAHGADIVVHSATKYIGGHGTAIGGVIIDGGTFDWRVQRDGQDLFPGFTTPDPSYNGVVFADLGAPAYALKARTQLLRDTGAAISPFNAFLLAQGIETLSLRVERHVANAQKVAEFLEAHPQVTSVSYAGLKSSPYYDLAQELLPKGAGAIIGFEIEGGIEAGKAFVNGLSLHSHVANIGDVRSLVIHPASTTHSQLSEDELLSAGVTPGLVRLAVGIEGIDDILADLETGFTAAAGVK
ncbi:MAG: bifunctional o-acetylhomoserine/o-acetylserine sulfhydrylase, partial [Gordonia sp. (in: high G+C Gram-positive bacteria)]